jgi:hypothetical protein
MTKEQIEEYRKKPVELKLSWLQAQMEFFYYAMPEKIKKIGNRIIKNKGK